MNILCKGAGVPGCAGIRSLPVARRVFRLHFSLSSIILEDRTDKEGEK
jgi:hypothetical protein